MNFRAVSKMSPPIFLSICTGFLLVGTIYRKLIASLRGVWENYFLYHYLVINDVANKLGCLFLRLYLSKNATILKMKNYSMKKNLFLFLLILSFKLDAQSKDTIFFKREVRDSPYVFYHAIFIDTSKKVRQRLTDFKFDNFDSGVYFSELKGLGLLRKRELPNKFPKKWIELYLYKGEYYLYKPSEAGFNIRFEITDSTTIDFSMEGAEPSRINQILVLLPGHILLNRNNNWDGKTVEINIIDAKKGIAVFNFGRTKYSYPLSRLMVDINKAYLFPLIHNYCVTDLQPEFEFDYVDFDKLLKCKTMK